MKEPREKLKQILHDLLSFQYSSAASMYILDGQRPPKKFGSNCYEQARNLKISLADAGFDQTYFIEETSIGRHRSLICSVDEALFYFNPYFMQRELIALDGILFERAFDSYPIVDGNHSTINVTRDNGRLTVIKQWPLQKRVDKFIFDINKPITKEWDFEEYFSRVFHPEQTTLSIRFLNTATGATDHLAYSVNDTGKKGADLFIKTNEHEKILRSDSKRFNAKLDELTQLIHSNEKETVDFMNGAIEIHKKFSNKRPEFSQRPVPFPY